jgi:hypothetical protein
MNINANAHIDKFRDTFSDRETYKWMQEFNELKYGPRNTSGSHVVSAWLPEEIALRYDQIEDVEQYYTQEEDVYFVPASNRAPRAKTMAEEMTMFQWNLQTHGSTAGSLRYRISELEYQQQEKKKKGPIKYLGRVWTEAQRRFRNIRLALKGYSFD